MIEKKEKDNNLKVLPPQPEIVAPKDIFTAVLP